MKTTQKLLLAGTALVSLLFAGCVGPYYAGGPGAYGPYNTSGGPYYGPYDGPYYGPFGPYWGGALILAGGYRHPGYYGGHHFYGNRFNGRPGAFRGGPGGFRGSGRGPSGGGHGGGGRGGR